MVLRGHELLKDRERLPPSMDAACKCLNVCLHGRNNMRRHNLTAPTITRTMGGHETYHTRVLVSGAVAPQACNFVIHMSAMLATTW